MGQICENLQSHTRRKYQISKFLVFVNRWSLVTLTGLIDLSFHFYIIHILLEVVALDISPTTDGEKILDFAFGYFLLFAVCSFRFYW